MRPDLLDRAQPAESSLSAALDEGLAALELPLEEPIRRRLLDYLALLAKWNAVYNLTAIREPRAMLVQHLLDSLAVLPLLRRRVTLARARVADVGSGAGLPGLPLALVEPGMSLVSIEPTGKKAAFQRQVCNEFALTNVKVVAGRAESQRGPMDLILCRAFASLIDFVDCSTGLAGPHTLRAALKGRRVEVEAERASLPPGWQVEVEPVAVPGLAAERHLVWIAPASPAPHSSPVGGH